MNEPLRGFTNVMSDGTKVVTEIVSEHGAVHLCLYLITQKIRDEKDMVVGFDTECSLVDTEDSRVEPRVVLIKLFSCVGCVLIRLNHKSGPVCPSLLNFFMMKDIVFVGVHVNEDVRMLKENYVVVVRNVVELSELAAYGLRKPRLFAYGARDLARDVLKLGLEQRPQKVAWMSWTKVTGNALLVGDPRSGSYEPNRGAFAIRIGKHSDPIYAACVQSAPNITQ